MADIFISYAKADRPLALKLAAMLEAEDWTTWWDTNLAAGDDFGPKITPELDRARAVIVIWTDTSTKSRWVRPEANRASKQDKLIPIKLPRLTYDDLPQPFDLLQTENIGEEDKIKAIVDAQLAKPAVEPSAWTLLTKAFKYELLTWVGIVGGAMTLFTAIALTLVLAPWAQFLVDHWRQWTHAFWVRALGWLGIHVPPEWTPVLSFLLFGSLLTIGQAVRFNRLTGNQPIANNYQGRSFQLNSWRTILCTCAMLVGTLASVSLLFITSMAKLPNSKSHLKIIIL
jgi:TIR domain-containing protein